MEANILQISVNSSCVVFFVTAKFKCTQGIPSNINLLLFSEAEVT